MAVGVAQAADEPCYGHSFDDRVQSAHFWVEWEEGALTEERAEAVAGFAEEARAVYLDLGWPLTDQPIVYEVTRIEGGGIGGRATTVSCEGVPVPRLELYVGGALDWSSSSPRNVTVHELAHAAEYGFMGRWDESVESWLWWMEGSAVWLAAEATGETASASRDVQGYLDAPDLALHHGLAAFLIPEQSDHMYGTAWLARYLDERHGGPGTVRDLWDWGADHSGEPIFFPDAVAGIGLDFDAVWAEHLARAATAELSWDAEPPAPVAAVAELPTAGELDEEDPGAPEGLGFAVVEVAEGLGGRGDALRVRADADHAVLVHTLDGQLLSYTPFDGEGWISGFTRDSAARLVLSPHAMDAAPFALSWEIDLVDDPGPMPGTVLVTETPRACGCATGPAGWTWLALLPVLLRRRR